MRRLRFVPIALALALTVVSIAHAQAPDTSLWVTNGSINAALRIRDTLYVAGQFTRVAPNTGSAVPIDSVTAQPRLPFARVSGSTNAVVADGAGGWFVGGRFNGVDGSPRRNLAHVLASGGLAAWTPDPDSEVFALALSGSTLYVGGRFEHLGGAARYKIGAVDVITGLATAFDPNPPKPAFNVWPIVFSLATAPGVVYAGGIFFGIGGQSRNAVAALDPITGAATAWNAQAPGGFVQAIAPAGSTLYVGGAFSSMGGSPRLGLAELSASTGYATAFVANVNGNPRTLAISGTTLYVGGLFNQLGGQPRAWIGAVDRATSVVTAFDPNPSNVGGPIEISGLWLDDGRLYVAGQFTSIGGQTRRGVAALNPGDGLAQAWDPHVNGNAAAVAASNGVVFVGGTFGSVGGVARTNLASLALATGHPTGWAPTANGSISDMVSDGTSLFIGGYFTIVSGFTHPYVARLDVVTGNVADWDPGVPNVVACLARDGTRLYVGGYFTALLLAVDAQTGQVSSWSPAITSGPPGRIVPDPGAGAVTVVSQVGVWRFRTSDAVTLWHDALDGDASALTQMGGTLYVGGGFTHVNGLSRSSVAALDAASGGVLPWNPGADGGVYGLEQDGVHLIVGGGFRNFAGVARQGFAVLDPVTGVPTSFDVHLDANLYRPILAGAEMFLLGGFGSVGNFAMPGFARIDAAPPLDAGGPPAHASALRLDAAPVPASTHTVLRFALPAAARVWLEVLDLQGRRIASPLAGELFAAGPGTITLRTRGWAPGVYLARLRADDAAVTRRIVVSHPR